MGEIEIGTCTVCQKENVPVVRTYYRYDIKCDCCNGKDDDHFEIAVHCSECTPKPPRRVSVSIQPKNKNQ